MIVESNYAIAIATLCDWLNNIAPVFLTNEKAKPIASCTRDFSRALSKLQVIAWSSDLFAHVLIGRRNYFGIGCSTVI